MATVREIKSLKDGNIDNMTDKEAIEWLKIWHKKYHCEVARAKAAYEAANKNCLAEGVMLGGSRRRRRRHLPKNNQQCLLHLPYPVLQLWNK